MYNLKETEFKNLKTGLFSSMSLTYTENTSKEDKKAIKELIVLPKDSK